MKKNKNILLKTFCLFTMIAISSCEKSLYSCKCDGGFSGTGTEIQIETYSKKRAIQLCQKHNSKPDITDGFHDCELK